MVRATDNRRRKLRVFHSVEAGEVAPEMMPREGIDESVLAGLAQLQAANVTAGLGEVTRVLFRESGDSGMSLVSAWFKSGYVLPFHSHSVDCLYYIVGGELHMGSHVLKKGDGFCVPADHAYGYEAGPDGVEILEFRSATRFNLAFKGNKASRWVQIAQTFGERAAIWATETVPPSERGKAG